MPNAVTTATTATVRRPRITLAALVPCCGALLCIALIFLMRVRPNVTGSSSTPEAAPSSMDSEEQFRKLNLTMTHWASRAHAGGGKIVVTSQEIKEVEGLIHDSCR